MKKITTKAVAEQSGISLKLITSVIRQLGGRESLPDVASHGASGGFGGFCYYSETLAFFRRHRADIMALAENMASELGEDTFAMISGFNCLKDQKLTAYEIAKAINSRDDESNITQVQNALAWFALEEVARAFGRAEENE